MVFSSKHICCIGINISCLHSKVDCNSVPGRTEKITQLLDSRVHLAEGIFDWQVLQYSPYRFLAT